jgi:glycosyltransferase involved in cell wall biosynthesis
MKTKSPSTTLERVALLGNHLPRRCGIATFTTDLAAAISATFPAIECPVVALTDHGRQYSYGRNVRFEIHEGDLAAYRRAADYLNVSGVDVLCVQHEYGIFGGKSGSHLLSVLGDVRMPVVTTLHTILSAPNASQRLVMDEVIRLSDRLVVMSHHGIGILREVHGVKADKIDFVPHGIPTLPSREASRERLGVGDSFQLLTFGLISPDKGLEYVIDALPSVVERYPNTVYVIVGATHPHIQEQYGETYRRSLQQRALRLGVEKNVVFYDRFVDADELGEFLAAADVYITPYLNPEQITSGTLAYALGNGKPVISTPYQYAREVLADGRGILVPMRDSAALAEAVERLIRDRRELDRLSEKAAEYGRSMTWPSVAKQYVASFERAQRERAGTRGHAFLARKSIVHPVELPALDLRHVATLTDSTGILQHAMFSVPRYADGYCVDDNARALLLTTLAEEAETVERQVTRPLASRYLAFLAHAFNPDLGHFRNFMGFGREWLEASGSEDSHGRALWALGAMVGRSGDAAHRALSGRLFQAALPAALEFGGPRSVAFALLGLCEYLKVFQGERNVEAARKTLAERLIEQFQAASTPEWVWFGDCLTYDNARVPQALLLSGRELGNPDMVAVAMSALDWLVGIQRAPDGCFLPVGSNGFFPKGGKPATFDQQPLEACATVSACLDAWRVTADRKWINEMWRAFSWFLGENVLHAPLYDPTTGGCRDGLHVDRANENQGAESTLSFLLALADMTSLEAEVRIVHGRNGIPERATATSDCHV